jgi:hypothetical protein
MRPNADSSVDDGTLSPLASTVTERGAQGTDIEDQNTKGLIPRITEQIFQSIMSSPANLEYLVSHMACFPHSSIKLGRSKSLSSKFTWSASGIC